MHVPQPDSLAVQHGQHGHLTMEDEGGPAAVDGQVGHIFEQQTYHLLFRRAFGLRRGVGNEQLAPRCALRPEVITPCFKAQHTAMPLPTLPQGLLHLRHAVGIRVGSNAEHGQRKRVAGPQTDGRNGRQQGRQPTNKSRLYLHDIILGIVGGGKSKTGRVVPHPVIDGGWSTACRPCPCSCGRSG